MIWMGMVWKGMTWIGDNMDVPSISLDSWIGDGEDVGLTGLPLRRSSGGKQGKEGSWQGLEMQLISFSFGFFR